MKTSDIQCLCGAIKIRLSGEPIAQFYCHCDDCQAVHGGAYVPRAMYPSQAVEVIQGEPMTWILKTTPRTRCTICGTHLFAEVSSFGVRGVNAYLLPAETFKPQFHIQCQYAVLPIQDKLPHFKAFPAKFGGSDETVDW
ncbi:MAG: GFA family protein [Gammaproteobacteria bacterium]